MPRRLDGKPNGSPKEACRYCGRPGLRSGLCGAHVTRLQRGIDPLRPVRSPGRAWGTGTIKDGYKYLSFQTPDGRRYRKHEHRVIMEKYLGRELLEDETVHHRNGDRLDNRPENLELWSSRHPPGQRVEDLLAWAEDILRRYGGITKWQPHPST